MSNGRARKPYCCMILLSIGGADGVSDSRREMVRAHNDAEHGQDAGGQDVSLRESRRQLALRAFPASPLGRRYYGYLHTVCGFVGAR
jgi:hypothetical protein